VLFRLHFLERDRRASLAAEERLFWSILLSLCVSLSAALLLAAVGRYTFPRVLTTDVLIAAVLAASGRLRLRLGSTAPGPGVSALIPLALIVLGVTRFFPASEYVIGGKDPGTYVNEGVQIAQRGALVVRDPLVASVPAFARTLFFPRHALIADVAVPADHVYYSRFMGFFISDIDTGATVGQFPHLFPASMALGYGIDGLSGVRRTVGVWAILGVLAVYFAGARMFGRLVGGVAAALLTLHVIQVWFARYPNAELVMQALVFAAILAGARAHADGDPFFGPVAAALLGLMLFLRFDAVLAIAGVLGGLALGVLTGTRIRGSFVAVLGAASGLAAIYMLGPMRAYIDLPIVFLVNLKVWQTWAVALGGLLVIAAIALGARLPRVGRIVFTAAPVAIGVAVIAAALYAAFLREPGGRLAAYDAYALRTFTDWYLTLPGLLAALIGFALAARTTFWRGPALFTVAATYAFFFFYKAHIVPQQFWMARRFLPVVLPAALLFMAVAALAGARHGRPARRAIGAVIGATFLGLVAARYARASAPLLDHVEYAGIIPKLEQLASQVRDDDLLVVESREASDTYVLGVPLAFIYARQVLPLTTRLPDKAAFGAFLDWAHTRYRRVLFLGGGGTDLLSRQWTVKAIAGEHFQVPEYESALNAYPRGPRKKDFDYTLYEFAAASPADAGRPFDLDVGFQDDLHVLRFHAKEPTEGRTMRWSRDVSYISVPAIAATTREVTLWLADGGRPPAVPPADVSVFLADEPLGTVRVDSTFRPYVLPVPPALASRLAAAGDPVQLKLTTTVWNPERVLGTPDNRDLGVMVDRVAVR
jgi:hypothetical protein